MTEIKHRNIYKQAKGYLVQVKGHKTKFFNYNKANALQQAIEWRDYLLDLKPQAESHSKKTRRKPQVEKTPSEKKTSPEQAPVIDWENDSRTLDLQIKSIELEEELQRVQYQEKLLREELTKTSMRVQEFERNRKVILGEIEFERFKTMETVCIVDGSYLYSNATDQKRYSVGLLRKMLEGMIGGRLEDYIYVSTLPADNEQVLRKIESYHRYLGTPEGGNARVIAHETKETTIYCPKCSASFERRFQWAGDTVIASEIVRWALHRQVPRIILVAGDGDFIYPLELARSFCKEIVVVGFQRSMSMNLQGAANRVVYLDEYCQLLIDKR